MHRAYITPDRTRLLRPMHSRNAIMIPSNKPQAIISNHLILVIVNVVNTRDMETNASK